MSESKDIHSNPDAKVWAQFYNKNRIEQGLTPEDEAVMIGWFANAMMAMHDHIYQTKTVIDKTKGYTKSVDDLLDFQYKVQAELIVAQKDDIQRLRSCLEKAEGELANIHLCSTETHIHKLIDDYFDNKVKDSAP